MGIDGVADIFNGCILVFKTLKVKGHFADHLPFELSKSVATRLVG